MSIKTRLDLHNKLLELFENENIYYQAPSNLVMKYPAIRYSKNNYDISKGDNINYIKSKVYEIIIIDKKPDNPIIDKLLELPKTSFDRHYTSDNLNHDVINIYI